MTDNIIADNSLKDLFKLDKNEAKRRLAFHEQNKTLFKEVKKYHPFYISCNEVSKFILMKDLGLWN